MKKFCANLFVQGLVLLLGTLGSNPVLYAQSPSGWVELNEGETLLPTVDPSIDSGVPLSPPPLETPAPPPIPDEPSFTTPIHSTEFQSLPKSNWIVPVKSSKKDRNCRRRVYESDSRFNLVDPINPNTSVTESETARVKTPGPDYQLLQRQPSSPSPKVYLKLARLETLFIDDQPSYWLSGQLENASKCRIHNLTVHYRILRGLETVESGHFNAVQASLEPQQVFRFRYPVTSLGDLEVSFLEWKYGDGTSGITAHGMF